mmetsp:Transcript_25566/g.64314  ORF Transcript_25566/g.64314 Transcript_25566/m.64314 type:complete len:87 (-) Transcript_25566:27-287(-)
MEKGYKVARAAAALCPPHKPSLRQRPRATATASGMEVCRSPPPRLSCSEGLPSLPSMGNRESQLKLRPAGHRRTTRPAGPPARLRD